MSITKTQTVNKTITKIMIKWDRDDVQDIQSLDYQMILDTDNRVIVQDTFDAIMREGGCTAEQARQQTAGQIARVNAWREDKWTYVSCLVTALAEVIDAETGDVEDSEEVESDSLSGIESFSGKAYQSEVENDCIANLYSQLQGQGYTVTPEEWAALPREEAPDSYYEPLDTDPGENVRPLDPLPEKDELFSYRYGSAEDEQGDYGVDDAEGQILAVCLSCGVAMPNDADKRTQAPHYYGCDMFDESETDEAGRHDYAA